MNMYKKRDGKNIKVTNDALIKKFSQIKIILIFIIKIQNTKMLNATNKCINSNTSIYYLKILR